MSRRTLYITKPPTITYATWDPLKKGAAVTLSGGNLTAAMAVGNATIVLATIGKSTGKWFWEIRIVSGAAWGAAGIANTSAVVNNNIGSTINSWAYVKFVSSSFKVNNGGGTSYGSNYAVGDVLGVALDMTAGTIIFYKNGVSQGIAFSGLTGTIYPASGSYANNGYTYTANFGASAFAFSVPVGYNPGVY